MSVYQVFQLDPLGSFGIVSSTEESSEGEEERVVSKKEYEVDLAHLWVEVGGASIAGGGGKGIIEWGISLLLDIA